MNLLVINFEMDLCHGTLSWQPKVVNGLASICDKVIVLTSKIGKIKTPDNVIVYEIPKRPLGIPQRIGGKWALNWLAMKLCREHRIDSVFVHMAMEWSYRFYPTFKIMGLPVVVWYAHGSVSQQLKWAVTCATKVVTSTPEGCRIGGKKVSIIGQGIDTKLFSIPQNRELIEIISIGRITQRKRIDLLVDIADRLRVRAKIQAFKLKIIGPILSMNDAEYDQRVRSKVWDLGLQDSFQMSGYVPNDHLPHFYERAFLHINVSETNSMDKTVLEALACGCPVLTSNPSFFNLLNEYPEFIIDNEDIDAICEKIEFIFLHRFRYDPIKLRGLVLGHHDIDSFPRRVISEFNEIKKS